MNPIAHELAFVPIKKLDANGHPLGIASGCIVDYGGSRLIFTVFHAVGTGNWAMEADYDPIRGAKCVPLGGMTFLKSFNIEDLKKHSENLDDLVLGSDGEQIDIAFRKFDKAIKPVLATIDQFTNTVTSRVPRAILALNLDISSRLSG